MGNAEYRQNKLNIEMIIYKETDSKQYSLYKGYMC